MNKREAKKHALALIANWAERHQNHGCPTFCPACSGPDGLPDNWGSCPDCDRINEAMTEVVDRLYERAGVGDIRKLIERATRRGQGDP